MQTAEETFNLEIVTSWGERLIRRDIESLAAAAGSANPQQKRRETKTDPDALASAETITPMVGFLAGQHDRIFGYYAILK